MSMLELDGVGLTPLFSEQLVQRLLQCGEPRIQGDVLQSQRRVVRLEHRE